MCWYIAWGIALGILVLAAAYAIALLFFRYKRKRVLTPNRALISGTVGAAFTLFYPLYFTELGCTLNFWDVLKTGLVSLQHALRLFAFDGDYKDIVEMVDRLNQEELGSLILSMYKFLGAVLYIVAPILTVGLILSFFKNLVSHIHYVMSFWMSTHVFSELNEKSLALAKSIDEAENKKGEGENRKYRFLKKALIVFTDVMDKKEEENLELIQEAKEIGAILFRKDLESIKYRNRKWSFRKVNFYLISDDEEEKIRHAESIMQEYDISDKIELRLFSDDIRSELLLAAKNVQHMKAIRVNEIQSLIYHNLDTHGLRLFENARGTDGPEKTISAVIIGLGKYGLEMMKALVWFCQMPGYKVKITAFDKDENAEEKFTNMCPELMSDKFNGQVIHGEARYDIKIHSRIDTNTPSFFDELSKIDDATYIFVCLGSDEANLSTAVKIKSLCQRVQYVGDGNKPIIETVIYDSNVRNLMGLKWGEERNGSKKENDDGVTNFKNQPYDLHMIGDLDNFYSVETFLDSELNKRGEKVNIRWAEENSPSSIDEDKKKFDRYEYNYRSSIAKAIHEKLRTDMSNKMGVELPGINMPREEILKDPDLCLKIGLIEHIRWNAYMRTEGYSYGEKTDHLAKKHECLVSINRLMETEAGRASLRKDV